MFNLWRIIWFETSLWSGETLKVESITTPFCNHSTRGTGYPRVYFYNKKKCSYNSPRIKRCNMENISHRNKSTDKHRDELRYVEMEGNLDFMGSTSIFSVLIYLYLPLLRFTIKKHVSPLLYKPIIDVFIFFLNSITVCDFWYKICVCKKLGLIVSHKLHSQTFKQLEEC